MTLLFIDGQAGISGDMFVGALLHLGLSLDHLREKLALLPWSGFTLEAAPAERHGLHGIQFRVVATDQASHRHLSSIRRGIEETGLSDRVKKTAVEVFVKLAEAEAAIHEIPVEKVHFHEIGAIDSIVDIVGVAVGIEALGVERCVCSPIRVGHGTVRIQHGEYPVPAPATLRLLKGVPTFAGDLAGEFTTPTGAALVISLCDEFCHQPLMRVEAAGYGAGSRLYESFPNMLRLALGDSGAQDFARVENVILLEANIDDMNPQHYDYLLDRLYASGALDVWVTPISMKKNRPATLVSVLASESERARLARELLAHSTTLGVRFQPWQRYVLERDAVRVETSYGPVRVKRGWLDGEVSHFWPEYEDCRRLAETNGVALKIIQAEALRAYLDTIGKKKIL